MCNADARVWDEFVDRVREALDVTDPIMNEEHLPAATNLKAYRVPNDLLIVCLKFGGHWLPVGGGVAMMLRSRAPIREK